MGFVKKIYIPNWDKTIHETGIALIIYNHIHTIIKKGGPHIKEGSLSLLVTLTLSLTRLTLSLDINRSRIDREARTLDYGYNLQIFGWSYSGADPGSFLGGGALVSSNKPHTFFCRIPVVLENRRSSRGGCAPPAPSP